MKSVGVDGRARTEKETLKVELGAKDGHWWCRAQAAGIKIVVVVVVVVARLGCLEFGKSMLQAPLAQNGRHAAKDVV